MTGKVYFNTDEMCERLGVEKGTLARWRANGDGPEFIRASHKIFLYPIEGVLAWEKDNLQSPGGAR